MSCFLFMHLSSKSKEIKVVNHNGVLCYILLINSFIHSFCCLSTVVPQSIPKRALLRLRYNTSSFNLQYTLISIRSSSSCLRLLLRLLVTSIHTSIFPSITCFKGSSCSKCDQSSYPSSFLLFVGYSPLRWLFVTLLHFSHRSN